MNNMPVLADPVATQLRLMGNRLNAITCIDVNKEQHLEYREANAGENVFMLHPSVKIQDGNSIINAPMSAAAAGAFGVREFWKVLTNVPVEGILGTSEPISFSIDDPLSDGQVLNSKQIATIVRQDGFRFWGSRGTGDPSVPKKSFIHYQRIRFAIREALIAANAWAVGKELTRSYFDEVTRVVNEYMAKLATLGAIAGGKCFVDEETNTPSELENGHASFGFEYSPTPVSEKVTFYENITNSYLKNILG